MRIQLYLEVSHSSCEITLVSLVKVVVSGVAGPDTLTSMVSDANSQEQGNNN